jgi:hypothetical protein
MSHINDGLDIYFQTGSDYLKMRQIRANQNVAVCVAHYQIEGVATEMGHPLSKENTFFAKAFERKHPGSFAMYSPLSDEVVVKVTVKHVQKYGYIDGKIALAEAYF